MRKSCIAAIAALALAGLLTPASAQFKPSARTAPPEKILMIYGWSDYIDPAALEDFSRESGIKAAYDTYESQDEADQKMLGGKTGYDLVIIAAPLLQKHIQAGIYQKLDRARLPHINGLAPEISARLAAYDPGNLHAIDYMYFTGGLAYSQSAAKQRLPERPPGGWDVFFNPDMARKFVDCGIELPDNAEEAFSAALLFLRLNPGTRQPADLKRAGDLLVRLRAQARRLTPAGLLPALASGETCLAMVSSAGAAQAMARAAEARSDVKIEFAVPREGALLQLDVLAVPKDAPHPQDAHRLIDFLLRPEIAARNTAFTQIANGVAASRALLPRAIADSASIYPGADVLKRLTSPAAADANWQKQVAREWARVKAGK